MNHIVYRSTAFVLLNTLFLAGCTAQSSKNDIQASNIRSSETSLEQTDRKFLSSDFTDVNRIGWQKLSDSRYTFDIQYPPQWSIKRYTLGKHYLGDYAYTIHRETLGFLPAIAVWNNTTIDNAIERVKQSSASGAQFGIQQIIIKEIPITIIDVDTKKDMISGMTNFLIPLAKDRTLVFSSDKPVTQEFLGMIGSVLPSLELENAKREQMDQKNTISFAHSADCPAGTERVSWITNTSKDDFLCLKLAQ